MRPATTSICPGPQPGTATGAITWSYKCRVGDSFTALGGTCTGTSCTATDVCDYIADAAGTYAPSLQSTRQSITDDTPGTFTITGGGPPSTPQLQGGTLTGGRISWLGDMIRRGGWRSLCERARARRRAAAVRLACTRPSTPGVR